MFTIKAIQRGADRMHGYEALSYTRDDVQDTLEIHCPDGMPWVTLSLGRTYERIIVENSAGKTVENMYLGDQAFATAMKGEPTPTVDL